MSKPDQPTPPIPGWQRRELGYAVSELGKALSARDDDHWGIMNGAEQAAKSIARFFGEVKPTPELTKEEGAMYHALHVWMRKGMDGPLSTLLWTAVDRSLCADVYCAFVRATNVAYRKGEWNAPHAYRQVMHAVTTAYHQSGDPNAVYLASALRLWPQDEWADMLTSFKDDGWVDGE